MSKAGEASLSGGSQAAPSFVPAGWIAIPRSLGEAAEKEFTLLTQIALRIEEKTREKSRLEEKANRYRFQDARAEEMYPFGEGSRVSREDWDRLDTDSAQAFEDLEQLRREYEEQGRKITREFCMLPLGSISDTINPAPLKP